jgi:hypothetical protein
MPKKDLTRTNYRFLGFRTSWLHVASLAMAATGAKAQDRTSFTWPHQQDTLLPLMRVWIACRPFFYCVLNCFKVFSVMPKLLQKMPHSIRTLEEQLATTGHICMFRVWLAAVIAV